MPNLSHDRSQELSSEASILTRNGHTREARALYLQAASLEVEALSQVGSDKPRTRGILAVSLVSQYYKAAAYDDAEMWAYSLLVERDLPEFSREQLRELLGAIWEEKALSSLGLEYSEETIFISLKGPDIGDGVAPVALVTERIRGVQSLLYRIAEWRGNRPFRRSGPPPSDIMDVCRSLITEPQKGSFRFGLRFVQPIQLELIPTETPNASVLSKSLFKLIQIVTPIDFHTWHNESLEHFVPDRQYRQAMLKLLRNVVPDGRKVREIEFTNVEEGMITDKALLHEGSKFSIDNNLRIGSPSEVETFKGEPEPVNGILRAIHLDQDWLEVMLPDHASIRCVITHEVLDDVVGPMVNQSVIVYVVKDRTTKQFQLIDIELDNSQDMHQR